MKKLLLVGLFVNAALLAGRFLQEVDADAPMGGGAVAVDCGADPTKYSIDANADGGVDLSDAVFFLSWLFQGTEAPRVCLANTSCLTLEQELALGLRVEGFTFAGVNAQGYSEFIHDETGILFVRLPGGSFNMGSPLDDPERDPDEGPVRPVSLSPFLIAKYEVTQEEWRSVVEAHLETGLDADPSSHEGDNLPVEMVTWEDCRKWLDAIGLDFPSEAQWEYACRAGTSGSYSGTGNLDDMGWYILNSGVVIHPVGGKQANQFGLHDLHGNVYEFCEDVFDVGFYGKEVPGFDPLSTSGIGTRVIRGGSFNSLEVLHRSPERSATSQTLAFLNLGLRIVKRLP